MFQGQMLSLEQLEDGFVELNFNASKGSVNVFNQATMTELTEALTALDGQQGVKGMLITSGKSVFIAGADITEFGSVFNVPEDEFRAFIDFGTGAFDRVANLPFPTVVAINGFALGGGFEFCLACDYRVMSDKAQVGLPEAKLGIIPGWGGTVRLPRVIGLDNAVEWIASGGNKRADKAIKVHAVDAVVDGENLRSEALAMLKRCADGELDYQERREEKRSPLKLNKIELGLAATTCKAQVGAVAGRNYPAPIAAVDAMSKAATMSYKDAMEVEFQALRKVTQTPQSRALVGLFLGDQYIDGVAKKWGKQVENEAEHVTVLGAGIMGGGIAYQNALKGIPVLMKDISTDSLALGMNEANKLLAKQVDKGRISALKAGETLSKIMPSLSYEGVGDTAGVVEAVVENPKIKKAVLAEVESLMDEGAVLASNTSTISIDELASDLKRPENFCGIHFFNPVHVMPLVEIIRGEKTSDQTIAKAVSHIARIGKKPIVVNNCPGFYVNRVLFPTVFAFDNMVMEGVDLQQIDKVIERWGWPMGPAYLMDVVGIDTAAHCLDIMDEGFPDRMNGIGDTSPVKIMAENNRYGQKNGKGFYQYVPDKRGKPKKTVDEETYELLAPYVAERQELDSDEIVTRFMIPLCTEVARCLEEGIVGSPAEADMALIYGLGFPPFRGGVCRWMDEMGLDKICEMADQHKHLGKLYEPTETMRAMATSGERYYG